MRFAIVTETIDVTGVPVERVPIVGSDLEQRVVARLRRKVRLVASRGELERALHEAFVEEENAVRMATFSLGPEHV